MTVSKISFGTDGWRGLLAKEVNLESIQRVAQAFSVFIKKNGTSSRVAVGFDGRRSSAKLAKTFSEVLSGNGIDVLLSDKVVPTPYVSFATKKNSCDAGVMITASHNPPNYNGIKFKTTTGSPFLTNQTKEVESLLDVHDIKTSNDRISVVEFATDYLNQLGRLIDFELIKASGLKILVDSMSGAGGTLIEDILKPHGVEVTTIFGTPNEDFSGRLAEPILKNLAPLSEILHAGDYSLGLATDGDADRLGVMTNAGEFMNIQETIIFLANYIKNTRKIQGPVIKTASVTDKLIDSKIFGNTQVIDVQVGFKYVAEAMIENRAAFGAEESGGFGFKDHIPERDGIFAALLFIEMLAVSGFKKLDEFIDHKRKTFGVIFYDRIDFKCNDEKRFMSLDLLARNLPAKISAYQVLSSQSYQGCDGQINGLKIWLDGNPRWLLLRVSETEPMVRVYAEGQSNEEVSALLKEGKALFEKLLQNEKVI